MSNLIDTNMRCGKQPIWDEGHVTHTTMVLF